MVVFGYVVVLGGNHTVLVGAVNKVWWTSVLMVMRSNIGLIKAPSILMIGLGPVVVAVVVRSRSRSGNIHHRVEGLLLLVTMVEMTVLLMELRVVGWLLRMGRGWVGRGLATLLVLAEHSKHNTKRCDLSTAGGGYCLHSNSTVMSSVQGGPITWLLRTLLIGSWSRLTGGFLVSCWLVSVKKC